MSGPSSPSVADTQPPDPIEILVGPDERRFIAPRRVLSKVPFFRACLDAPMQEGRSGTIKLPEDDGEAFVEGTDYIFNGRLGSNIKHQTLDVSPISGIPSSHTYVLRDLNMFLATKTYNLARKLGIEDLPNEIIDEIQRYKDQRPKTSRAELIYVFGETAVEEKLHKFLLSHVIHDIKGEGGWDTWVEKNEAIYEEFINGKAANMEAVVSAAVQSCQVETRRNSTCAMEHANGMYTSTVADAARLRLLPNIMRGNHLLYAAQA